MIKPILTGVWVCAATMGASYLGAAWQRPAPVTEKRSHEGASGDLTTLKTRMISVPIVAGIMPISTKAGMVRMAELAAGARFPADMPRP